MARIEVRVDDELKAKAEEACAYLGCTLSSIIHHQLRSTIDEYYKQRANDTRHARLIAEGDNHQFMLEAAKREAYILNKLGFDSYLHMADSRDAVNYQMFYNFLLERVCNDLGIDYVDMTKRLKGEKML